MKKWDIIVNSALGAIVATIILGAGGFLFKSVWDYSSRISILEVNQNATNRTLISEVSRLEHRVSDLINEIRELRKSGVIHRAPEPVPRPPAPEPDPVAPEPPTPAPEISIELEQIQGTGQSQDLPAEGRIRDKLKGYRQDQVQMQSEK